MQLNTELQRRQDKIRQAMRSADIDVALITCNVNLLYTCGRIISGYIYLPVEGEAWFFVKRPNTLKGDRVVYIRKPEQIADELAKRGIPQPNVLMLEADELSFTEYTRLSRLFAEVRCVNGTPIIRQARSVKTDQEIALFQQAADAHTRAYHQIPNVFRLGMNDLQFSIEIERLMRLEGSLGIFRVFGQSMEIFMGSVLAGSNAENASPYDFALGGEGLSPALPGGLNGTPLKEGTTVMVDLGGNFNGYMCDMSRVFTVGQVGEEVHRAHELCLAIQQRIAALAVPGAICEELYEEAIRMVTEAGFADRFMGVNQQAGFIGHGIGLEINEAPVLAPRIKQRLEVGMVFALEPKIVLPGIGPVGVENSWVVTEQGVRKLTNCTEVLIDLMEKV